MPALVEVLSVDEGAESEGDAVPEPLLVPKSNLGGVVDLGPHGGVPVQGVLAANAEVGGVARAGPAEVDAGLQLGVDPLVDGAAEDLSVVDVGVEDKVTGGVADAEVVLGDLGLGGVKGHLVSWENAKKKYILSHFHPLQNVNRQSLCGLQNS